MAVETPRIPRAVMVLLLLLNACTNLSREERAKAVSQLKLGDVLTMQSTQLACDRACVLLLKGNKVMIVSTNSPHVGNVCVQPIKWRGEGCLWTDIEGLISAAP